MTNFSQRFSDLTADLMIEVVAAGDSRDRIRAFRAVEAFTEVCTRLSQAIAPGTSTSLRPVIMVEDVEAGSVIAWLRQEPNLATPPSAANLEHLNTGVVESAKWLSKVTAGADFQDLMRSLEALQGVGTDSTKPDGALLLRALCDLQDARANLENGDRVILVAESGGVLLDNSSLVPTAHLLRSAARWSVRNDAAQILLVVQAPDYSGGSIWKVQHNGAMIEVAIEDRPWLDTFRRREINVREGDVLRGVATTEQHYAADGTLLGASMCLTSVLETALPNAIPAPSEPQPAASSSPATPAVPPKDPRSISLAYSRPLNGHMSPANTEVAAVKE
jgi:hypothetical protein